MRLYIMCHMLSSLKGKIDGAALMESNAAFPLKLKSLDRREKDTLRLRYEVARS